MIPVRRQFVSRRTRSASRTVFAVLLSLFGVLVATSPAQALQLSAPDCSREHSACDATDCAALLRCASQCDDPSCLADCQSSELTDAARKQFDALQACVSGHGSGGSDEGAATPSADTPRKGRDGDGDAEPTPSALGSMFRAPMPGIDDDGGDAEDAGAAITSNGGGRRRRGRRVRGGRGEGDDADAAAAAAKIAHAMHQLRKELSPRDRDSFRTGSAGAGAGGAGAG
eukprot:CAMPEP_0196769870 /NCGR_PEP_ID=MMETSP1104-20130614/799_1 /TAXON_ID=33652 /ORGANISM="Cafeteria sp., Strain Caron Lab Isolate" /LENGTH=227 /DNA_ID=CAMNT_0042139973 /DNA_START=100 /DNA_END=779 /DNA_ORIENTATION=-